MAESFLVPSSDLPGRLRDLLARAVPSEVKDDRYDQAWETRLLAEGDRFVGAALLAEETDRLLAYVGGFHEGDHLHLDSLVDRSLPNPTQALQRLIDLTRSVLDPAVCPVSNVSIWAKPSFDWHEELTDRVGLRPDRVLHQMRATLPINLHPIATRAFKPGSDNESLRLVNNRAFANHPDQGEQTRSQFTAGLNQSWVNPEGIRLFEINDRLAGFCWTRIRHEPPLGEIYVIGIDPDFHGQGLGKPLTAAGLAWLQDQGLKTAMLYVEADNLPALTTYERLGFRTVRTDRSWRLPDQDPRR